MNSNAKKIIKIGGISLFFILIIVYGFFISRELIFGVQIENVNIVDGATIAENTITVTGTAKNAIFLSLNGREISIDKTGNWTETIALLSGYNIVTIVAKDKFGNVAEANYKLIHPAETGQVE